jgi:hypothetical protein
MNLENERLKQKLTMNIIVIDNFYDDPYKIREFAIKQTYTTHEYHPGMRSESFATEHHKEIFNKILEPFSGKITDFYPNCSNGAFQYNTANDIKSWIHVDSENTNWAGIIYLTPNAPVSGGTGFFKYKDGSINLLDTNLLNNDEEIRDNCRDNTKWELVSSVGNLFNRLVLFNSSQYHMSLNYFVDNLYNGRFMQVFFFTTD